jgi:hypothetical protein
MPGHQTMMVLCFESDRLRGLLVTFFYLLLFHPRVFTRVSFERKGRSRQENRDLGIRGQA